MLDGGGWNDCSLELRELACCVSVFVLGFLWTNPISLSFKAGPSRPWKFRVCCSFLYQLMITLPFEHLHCFVFPPGVSHFPCNFKTFSTNFFRDSKSFIHTNFPSLRWRYSSSQDSGLSEEDSVSKTWTASASESYRLNVRPPCLHQCLDALQIFSSISFWLIVMLVIVGVSKFSRLTINRGSQRRFPPKCIENAF